MPTTTESYTKQPSAPKKKRGPDDIIRDFIQRFNPLRSISDALDPEKPRKERSGNINQNKLLKKLMDDPRKPKKDK